MLGKLRRVVLKTKKTIKGKRYTNIRSFSRADTWFLHHNNAPAHFSKVWANYLASTGLQVVKDPPYNPDLAPCSFGLFPHVKNRMKVRRFSNEEGLLRQWFPNLMLVCPPLKNILLEAPFIS